MSEYKFTVEQWAALIREAANQAELDGIWFTIVTDDEPRLTMHRGNEKPAYIFF